MSEKRGFAEEIIYNIADMGAAVDFRKNSLTNRAKALGALALIIPAIPASILAQLVVTAKHALVGGPSVNEIVTQARSNARKNIEAQGQLDPKNTYPQ
jgi:hypothetical protein